MIAVDTAYSLPRLEVIHSSAGDATKGNSFIIENPENFTWTWFTSPEDHLARRTLAHREFKEHFCTASRTYVGAALPHLPFADGTFALTLSSHFLFTYADRLDENFHYMTLVELCRVTSGEVRIFPLTSFEMCRYPFVESLRSLLDKAGIASEIRTVEYEFQQSVNEMLVLEAATAVGPTGQHER